MSNNYFIIGILALLLGACTTSGGGQSKPDADYIQWVDPLIGSGGHGHVFVGASLPHGMVQLGPNNLTKGWDWCSGYHDADSTIVGFAHTHISGTGIADLGDILFMPVVGNIDFNQGTATDLTKGYVSTFDKRNQTVRPGYYSVVLDKYNITAELTATDRVGFHRYTYPKGQAPAVIIDLDEGVKSIMSRKGTLDADFRLINDSTIAGYRRSDEWATDHNVWFTTVFSRPIVAHKTVTEGKAVKAHLTFAQSDKPLLVKTGISYVSEEGAALNLRTELPGWDFDGIVHNAQHKWNEALACIEISANEHTKKIFYTGLYHAMIAPSLFMDVGGKYRGADGNIHRANDFVPYTVFSLWDTYRAVHPLYTLIDNRVSDYVNSLLTIYDQQGTMPVWHLAGNETNTMVGVHSIPVVVDACLKGFEGIDRPRAWEAVSSIARMHTHGLDYVRENRFIPADKVSWSVARGLEYAIDDYCVAQLAHAMGKEEEYHRFMERAAYYKEYFDPATGFMRGKLSDGSRRKAFNPSHSVHMEDDYVEGNGWQYTWLVPHDVEGLIELFGSRDAFFQKFDSLFTVSSELNEGASIDISGLIGQYAHGNEPSHHTLYLYTMAGKPWKTAELVRRVYDEFYHTLPDGLIGNEDCGQMSSWYILSALGFYPVNPANGEFVFGSPIIDSAKIHLNNGNTFHIIAHHNSQESKYIKSVKLNGNRHTDYVLKYEDIMKGGTLEFEMSTEK